MNTSLNDALKPCPICNGAGEAGSDAHSGIRFAGCADADCIGFRIAYDFVTINAAIAAWNTRANTQEPGEVVVTTNQQGVCVAVTRQNEDGKILSVIWEAQESSAAQGAMPTEVRDWYQAEKARIEAVHMYNARLKFVQDNLPFGTSVDPEYQLMHNAEKHSRTFVVPMFNALDRYFALQPSDATAQKIDLTDDLPQPYACAVTLLETFAEGGMLAFFEDGTPTPNRKLCIEAAHDIRLALANTAQGNADLLTAKKRVKELESTLEYLDALGGLGHTTHKIIASALAAKKG